MLFVNTTATFESAEHGTVSVSGRYVAAERDTGTPAFFDLEEAKAGDADVADLLTDADIEEAQRCLFEQRAELIAAGARL